MADPIFNTIPETELLALCAWSECRGEPAEGQAAVIYSILERAKLDLGNDGKPDWWGEGIRGVILQKYQFSCFLENDPNHAAMVKIAKAKKKPKEYAEMLKTVEGVMKGSIPCPFQQVPTHYANLRICSPRWNFQKMRKLGKIGNHTFFREKM